MPKLIIKRDMSPKIISELEYLKQGESFNRDIWRSKAYEKAIDAIQNLDSKIYTLEDVIGVKNIGSSIILKIKEIIETGTCQKAQAYRKDPRIKLANQFNQINGIGPVKAHKLIESGITDVSQLTERQDLLTTNQRLGLKHYHNILKRIPRSEMFLHNQFLIDNHGKIDLIVAGSYRRNCPYSGDIDVLIKTSDDDVSKYHSFINKLKKLGYLIDDISKGNSKYNGYCQLDSSHPTRRIDIMFCTKEEYPFALLYFTGSGDFNQEMRGILSKKGFRLNEHCLMESDGDGWKKVEFKCTSEKDIFEFIKIPYIEPQDRSRNTLKRVLGISRVSYPKVKLKIIKPKHKLGIGQTKVIDDHIIKKTARGYMCDCPKWKFQRVHHDSRTCKHIQQYLGRKPGVDPNIKTIAPHPINDKFDFLLANKWNPDTDTTGWFLSEKLDGLRSLWNGSEFISRLGNKFHTPKWFRDQMPKGIRLDGELFGGRNRFQSTVSIIKNSNSDQEWQHITFYVFDIPDIKEQFEKRIEQSKTLIKENQYIKIIDHIKCRGADHVQQMLTDVEKIKGEGLMIRKPGSYYEGKRSNTLLKVKTFYDAEAIIIGHNSGSGRHKGRMGSLQCKMECGKTFRIGTGFSDKIRDNPPSVGTIVTYHFQEYTKSGVPRFPSYGGIRIDMVGPKDYIIP